METKNRTYLIPLVMAIVMGTGLMLGHFLTPKPEPVAIMQGQTDYQKMADIIQILDRYYVDTVDGETLFEQTIEDMLHHLDPHSKYIPVRELAGLTEIIEGKFGGVGIRFFIIRDTICITHVLPHSPSQRAGLKSGDKILKIDGRDVASKKIDSKGVLSKLKGKENTPVDLVILREGKMLNRKVIRSTISVNSIIAAYMIDHQTGFIKISNFSISTADEFKAAAYRLKQEGMKKLILDIRNNGGGVLTGATKIVDEFLEPGLTIVETKGEHVQDYKYMSTETGILKDVDVAVLIDAQSASASEILAGAIQDNDRGMIIGRRSFGKGLVQEDLKLRDGSNLRLTIARYYTPTGRCIQKPYSRDAYDYNVEHNNRYKNGERYAVDSSLFVDSLKFITPGGKIVYGGGGITPDVFVPLDITELSWYSNVLRLSGIFTTFAFDYVTDKRNKWNSFDQFNRSFNVSEEMLDRFTTLAKNEYGIAKDTNELAGIKAYIKRRIKAEIASQLWLEKEYYQILNASDVTIQRAVKELR